MQYAKSAVQLAWTRKVEQNRLSTLTSSAAVGCASHRKDGTELATDWVGLFAIKKEHP
jgi:hypothetical protein